MLFNSIHAHLSILPCIPWIVTHHRVSSRHVATGGASSPADWLISRRASHIPPAQLMLVVSPAAVGWACAALLLGYVAWPSEQERCVQYLPTPKYCLPVFRNTLYVLLRQTRRIYDFLLEESQRHGGRPWRLKVLGRPPTVVFADERAAEDIFKTQFEHFVKGPFTSLALEDVLGQGIFAVDGAKWLHQRKTASHLFSLQMMRGSMEQVVRDHTTLLCERLAQLAKTNEVVNFKRLLDVFTMDIFTKIGFDVDVQGLQSPLEHHAFLDAFERASQLILFRLQQPMWFWRLKQWLSLGLERQMKKDLQLINGTIYDIISKSIEAKTQDASRKDLISLFLEKEGVTYANGERAAPDPHRIRDMTISFIAAGRDTTSAAMSWFLLMMNRHPEALEKIRLEIAEQLPALAQGQVAVPSMADVEKLTYLEAAIRENLRLNPVVAITTRTAAKDTIMYDGTLIKEGTRVVLSAYTMGRLETVWGPDAAQYKPERWIDAETGRLLHVSPFKFSVFLAGPRMCLGMKFAMMEMKIALAAVLANFDVVTVRDPFAFTYRASVTNSIRGPLEVRIRPT